MQFCHFAVRRLVLLFACAILWLPAQLMADHLSITRAFSGAWIQPDHQSQGLVLHIAEQTDGSKVGVAHWFTFGSDLETAWYFGLGPVEGHQIHMTLYSASGVGFLQPVDELDVSVAPVGTLVLDFHNCNKGSAAFDTPDEVIGSGEFRIQRLTALYRSRCSGGISDDLPDDQRPEKRQLRLHSVRDDISGAGKAMFWARGDRADFKVQAGGVPDGSYQLMVCNEAQGILEAVDGEGSLQFRSPAIDSKLLLEFDPRDCLIELHDDAGAALSSGDAVLALSDHANNDRDPHQRITEDLVNTGVLDGAAGVARFERNPSKSAFSVSISGVPAGLYPLLVGGIERGQIEVSEIDGVFKGQVHFSNPPKGDAGPLDFDPRGEIVEVLLGDAIILESLFPDE